MTEPVQDSVDNESDSKEYWVKTPWNCDLLQGNGVFPDITPDGVKMSGDEKEKAKEAAEELRIRLLVKEA